VKHLELLKDFLWALVFIAAALWLLSRVSL
jgi:hypothetical protein